MSALTGKRIAILEARMSSELANLIQRFGGTVLQAPALKEASLDAHVEVNELIERLQNQAIAYVVVQTGVGVSGLLSEAEKLNRKAELIALLQAATVIARGPKPLAVLSRNGIKADLATAEPHTTADLIATFEAIDCKDQGVAVVHYGERNAQLAAALQARRANLFELCLYEWQLPQNLAPMQTMITETIAGRVDVVAFTSQIQARHLFQVADTMGQTEALRQALQTKTTIASIGPTCSEVLRALGIAPHIEPEHPKMGFLVIAMQEYFA